MFVTWIERLAVASQQQARRNAMIASTALTQRRAQRIEVEDFLASLDDAAAPEVAGHAAHG
jgi:hypothetical protein